MFYNRECFDEPIEPTDGVDVQETDNERVVMDVLVAIERRELEHLAQLYHPEVWFEWPPGLPYSGRFQGASVGEMSARVALVWEELQPTDGERRLDAYVVASHLSTVVVHYTLKGVSRAGQRFETEILARYEVRDGLFAGAQMFHFDLQGLIAFLEAAAHA